MNKELIYKIALTQIPTIGPVSAKNLISYCGGFEAVFKTKKKALLKIPGIGEAAIHEILNQDVFRKAEAEVQFIERQKIQVHSFLEDTYPKRMKSNADSPVLLYMKGNTDLNHTRMVAIVGTRRPTEQGKAICEQLVKELKAYSVSIISGLAYGIDITAHQECVQQEIDTIGVLAHGLDRLYPAVHRAVANKMCKQGALLTEFVTGGLPDRENFPKRNRIVAAMCDALIVVESPKKGGSMISVDLANSYKKDVFAVPGRVEDAASKGCNYLIKTHKASLIENAEDLAEVMSWEMNGKKLKAAVQKQFFIELNQDEKQLVDLLKTESLSIDKLVTKSKISISRLSVLLLELEFKGILKPLPGNRFMLIK